MIANHLRSIIRTNFYRSIHKNEMLRYFSVENASSNNLNENENDKQQQQQIENLLNENKTLLNQIKDLDDKYKRALAEAENVRLRTRKQIDDTRIYAIQAFCKDLLEVSDIFKLAIDSIPNNTIDKTDNNDLKTLYNGVKMTEDKLLNVFKRHGLCQINPIGEKFNPNEHHALFQVQDTTKEPGTISVVTKIGFKLHDRTIRPAMVGVVSSSSSS